MKKPPDWSVDVEGLSHQSLADLLKALHGSNREVVLDLQREFIRRLNERGIDNAQIIRRLAHAVPRGRKLNAIAKEWAVALNVSVQDFKQIADAR